MEKYFKPPEPLNLDGNIAENWRKFQQKFENFMKACSLNEESEERKVAVLLNFVGDDALDLFNTFEPLTNQQRTLQNVLGQFKNHCEPKKNEIYERFLFNSIVQKEGQTFDAFLTELRTAVKSTGYSKGEEMVRDRLVFGVHDKSTQEKLLREPDLTLNKAIDICRAREVSKQQLKVLQNENSTVSAVKTTLQECGYCGYRHEKNKCPAFKKTCAKCKGKNHFARVCKSEVKEMPKKSKKKVHEVVQETSSSNGSEDEFFISSVKKKEGSSRKLGKERSWMKAVTINDKMIEFKLDTGAEVSIIPHNMLKLIDVEKIGKTNISLISYGSSKFKLETIGEIELTCKVGNMSSKVMFVVVNAENQVPLLGLQDCIKLNLVKRVDQIRCDESIEYKPMESVDDMVRQFPRVFEGLGKFPTKHHISLKENAIPKIIPIRRIPRTLNNRLKEKLDELEIKGIVKKVDKPTDWLNALVIVEKVNGDIRLCLDPKYLNEAIRKEHFLIPSVDEISSKLSRKKFFTVLDMRDGYWQIELDTPSSELCSFGTPFGTYQFLRMPFGISSAPEVFQKKNYELFGDISGVGLYFDDLIVTGETEEEHDRNLRLVLNRAIKYNVKFNKSKIQYKQKSVEFLGQIFSEKGISLNEKYVKAIMNMKNPVDKKELLRFLGMVKFVGKFIPNLSLITAPLRDLTRDDVKWHWNSSHDVSMKHLKFLLTNAPVLKFFDTEKRISLEVDASKDGLGACLLQEGHPVAFASRSLTKTEQKYAQIEKEMLAILFGVKKFHLFIYGLDVQVFSDHKPLERIFLKELQALSPRIQRMRLKLLNYKLNVEYKPGKEMYISDTLSRAYIEGKSENTDCEIDYVVHSIGKCLPMSEERKSEFKTETLRDPQLSLVGKFANEGWPRKKHKIPDCVYNYYKLREKIVFVDGLLFLENKLIVPLVLRSEMLKLLHQGHLGIEKTKARARLIFYWPGQASDIESYVKCCKICEKYSRKQCKEPLKQFPLVKRPWEMIGIDIFSYGGKSFLTMYDAYSNWLELLKLRDKSAESVICRIKDVFARFGTPDLLIADNVPFNSAQFRDFAKEWDFSLTFRSPNYPRSNGLAEKAVGIAKSMLKKSLEEGSDVHTALLNYRNSPLKHMGYSPSQLLNSRICKTKVPIVTDLLQPQICKNTLERIETKRDKSKHYYDKNAKKLDPLQSEQNVSVYNHLKKTWESGKIVNQHVNPRSYIVKNCTGNVLRRNRIDLKPSNNEFIELIVNDESLSPEYLSKTQDNLSRADDSGQCTSGDDTPLEDITVNVNSDKVTSRYGRQIKKPDRLNL